MKQLLFLFFITVLCGCANMGNTLSGGEKDQTEPVLKYASVDSNQIGFKGDKIMLSFNEYIILNNADDEIIISPLPGKKPTIKKLKKTVEISFKEPLKENTTYSIDFGNAIKDNNEGNVKHVFMTFSTGQTIDTLVLSGIVKDAYTGEPKENMTVGLYFSENYKDSVNTRPSYITKTDKTGRFGFRGLSSQPFNIVAFEDKNKDFIPETGSSVAFLDNTVVAGNTDNISLAAFKNESYSAYTILNSTKLDSGFYRVLFSKPIEVGKIIDIFTGKPGDSSVIWRYNKDSVFFYLKNSSVLHTAVKITIDTAAFMIYTDSVEINKKFKRTINIDVNTLNDNLSKTGEILLNSNYPLMITSNGALRMKQDSINISSNTSIKGVWQIRITSNFKPGKNYSLVLPDSSIKYIDGSYLKKKDFGSFKSKQEKDFGTIILHVKNKDTTNKTIHYLLELYSKEKTYKQTFSYTDKQIHLKDILPGSYKIRIIKDSNNNGIWDNGYIIQRIQPERIINISKDISIKPNWDTDAEVLID